MPSPPTSKALALNPDLPRGALQSRQYVLQELGKPEEAIASYRKALAIKPDFPRGALQPRSYALQDLGKLRGSGLASYRKALGHQARC